MNALLIKQRGHRLRSFLWMHREQKHNDACFYPCTHSYQTPPLNMRCKGLVLRRHRYARLLRQGWSSAVPHMQYRGASDTTGTILKSKRTIQAVAIVCIYSVPNIPCVRLFARPMPKSKLCGFTTKISRNLTRVAERRPNLSVADRSVVVLLLLLLPANKERNE